MTRVAETGYLAQFGRANGTTSAGSSTRMRATGSIFVADSADRQEHFAGSHESPKIDFFLERCCFLLIAEITAVERVSRTPIAYFVAFENRGNTAALKMTALRKMKSAFNTSSLRSAGIGTCASNSSPQTVTALTITPASTIRSTKTPSSGESLSTRVISPDKRSLRVQTKPDREYPVQRSTYFSSQPRVRSDGIRNP